MARVQSARATLEAYWKVDDTPLRTLTRRGGNYSDFWKHIAAARALAEIEKAEALTRIADALETAPPSPED